MRTPNLMKQELMEMGMNTQTFMKLLTDQEFNKYNYKRKIEKNEKRYMIQQHIIMGNNKLASFIK